MSSSSTVTTAYVTDQSSIDSLNRGPITTKFAPPASCLETLTSISGSSLYFGHFGTIFNVDCYPTGTSPAQALATGNWAGYYYSPAICPLGWTAATTFLSSVPIYGSPQYIALGSETTAALCCPSSYFYAGNGHQCASTITQGQAVVFIFGLNNGYGYDLSGTPTTNKLTEGTSALGDGVPIWWQNSDDEVLSSAYSMTPTSKPTSLPTSQPSTSTSTSTSTSSPPPTGLSKGAKIGIGVFVPLAVIAGLVLGSLLWSRRTRRRQKHEVAVGSTAVYKEQPLVPSYITEQAHELPDLPHTYNNRHELPDVSH
ncbi:hypothetical protein EJ02DRAFT_423372 [Clathrospora elynae]|uniref:Uncharacterized protein n=1 Tax=Clathrospora elynae TaxID=706981 RepID=A0A6A5SNI0_9PLEO|nr:hypothetical protein EJ02DRAFT_423372 [Clathrospora elynae]